jgi:hypothetical protein
MLYTHLVCGRLLKVPFAIAALLLLTASWALASTGYSNEISNITVQNVTTTTVDIVWDTVHPSTSQVVLARDTNFQGERRIPANPDPNLVNHHVVTVDKLMPYDASQYQGSYYFYVASRDVNGTTSTAPGPFDSVTGNPATNLLPLQTAAPDPNAASNFAIYTYGPTDVFAGSDLYFAIQIAQLSGTRPNIYIRSTGGYNNGTDGSVRASLGSLRNQPLNPQTISAHLECSEYNPNNSDAHGQTYDANQKMGFCYPTQYYTMNVRLRPSPQTVPGNYTVTVTLQDNGQTASTTYNFTVMATPTSFPANNSSGPAIPGKDVWEQYMLQLGHKYCNDPNSNLSRDNLNAAGKFLTSFGDESDAWYYDGGRVYQQIASYTNDPSWNHCALTVLDPYRQWLLNNNASMQLWRNFAYGMMMNYWRTGDSTNADALQLLTTNGKEANYGGWIDPYWIRETAYSADVRIANEMITGNRDRLLAKNIDKLLGHLDMVYTGQLGASHPFMVGLAMETAIHYYDMTVAEGNPDYRIPPMVKKAMDGLWRDYYVPSTHAFRYTRWDIPTIDNWPNLNSLVAPAWAWYWNHTGDSTSLTRGDDLFQHTFDVPGDVTWRGKQFSQVYKWSFDYVRWRSGNASSTIMQNNNAFAGPFPDTEPPIQTQVAVSNTTGTSATITWQTYENADSQVLYGGAIGSYPFNSPLLDGGPGMTKTHSVALTGLQPGVTYHYRVASRDAANNLALLADATFTTALQ